MPTSSAPSTSGRRDPVHRRRLPGGDSRSQPRSAAVAVASASRRRTDHVAREAGERVTCARARASACPARKPVTQHPESRCVRRPWDSRGLPLSRSLRYGVTQFNVVSRSGREGRQQRQKWGPQKSDGEGGGQAATNSRIPPN